MNAGNNTLIHLDNIQKVFLTDEVETHALAGVHIDIAKGEYVSITGPSGCGKSTLLAILGLLDTPTEGRYTLNNREVADIGASERAAIRNQEIGFVFQAFNLIGDLSVFENVELPLTYRDGVAKAERRERAGDSQRSAGVAAHDDRLVVVFGRKAGASHDSHVDCCALEQQVLRERIARAHLEIAPHAVEGEALVGDVAEIERESPRQLRHA